MAAPLTTTDLKRLAAEVSVQHGIRIDPDDPLMAVVTLNRLVFEEAIAQVLERINSAIRDFEAATEKVQLRAGGVLAREVRECGSAMRQEVDKALKDLRSVEPDNQAASQNPGSIAAPWHWIVVGLALAVALAGGGVWLGTTLR
jgi:hypothetical protein